MPSCPPAFSLLTLSAASDNHWSSVTVVLPFVEFHVKEIMQCIRFYIWLLLLRAKF